MSFCMPSELISLLECLDVKKLPVEWTFVRRSREYKLIMSWKCPGKKPTVVVRKNKKKLRKVPSPVSRSTKRSSIEKMPPPPKVQENNNEESSDDEEESVEDDTNSTSPGAQNDQSASPNVDENNRERPDSSDTGSVVSTGAPSINKKTTKEKQAIPINLKDKEVFDEWCKRTAGKKKSQNL